MLEAASWRLAGFLIRAGGGRERIVAIAVERSAVMVIALLAVLKAGAADLPLGPGDPASRATLILAATEPTPLWPGYLTADPPPDTAAPPHLLPYSPLSSRAWASLS